MAIQLKCPQCQHINRFQLDDLLGKYAVCQNCSALLKIVDDANTGDRKNKDSQKR